MSIHLTEQQQDAVFAAISLEPGECLCISGAAGSGKSVVIREILKHSDYTPLASTRQAAIAIGGTTVHSCLGSTPYYTKKGELMFKTTGSDLSLLEGMSVIIDEAYMLGREYIDLCLQIFERVVFVGDANQLPPVKEKVSRIVGLELRTIYLNRVHRYDGEILSLAGDCLEADGKDDLLEVFGQLKYQAPKFLPNESVLCYKNDTVRDYWVQYCAAKMRPLKWSVGDEVIILPTAYQCKEFELTSNMYATITHTLNTYSGEGRFDFRAEGDEHIVGLGVHTPRTLKELGEEEDALRATEGVSGKDWGSLYYRYKHLARLIPARFTTVHRAQGRTIDTVYISKDVLSCHDFGTAKALLYTAITRSSNELYRCK